jgi:TPR repeat protein
MYVHVVQNVMNEKRSWQTLAASEQKMITKVTAIFISAAKQGYSVAQFQLGDMYHDGEGVSQDYKEAARWLRKAAEQGVVNAQYSLGGMYIYGEGVAQDY